MHAYQGWTLVLLIMAIGVFLGWARRAEGLRVPAPLTVDGGYRRDSPDRYTGLHRGY